MSIEVNGNQVNWIENETVKFLLKRLRYTFPLVVVKINDKVIPRNLYADKKIPDNAKIAVIHMISGG